MWNRVRTVTKHSSKTGWNCPFIIELRATFQPLPGAEAVHQKRVKLSRHSAATTPCEILHKCNCLWWSRRWDRYVTLPNTRAQIFWQEYIAGWRLDWSNVSLVITLLVQCNGWQQTKTIATHGWMSGKPFKWLGSEQLPLACAKKDQCWNLV